MEDPMMVVASYDELGIAGRGRDSKKLTNGPMIHAERFPVMSEKMLQVKSVTMVTMLPIAGMTLRWVTL